MCVPVPVEGRGGQGRAGGGQNVNKNFKVTGGLPPASLDMLNQMTLPLRAAARVVPERRPQVMQSSMADMLAPSKTRDQWTRSY